MSDMDDVLEFENGIRLPIRTFEYVLRLSETTGLRNLALVRYLRSDGINGNVATTYAIAVNQWMAM